MYFHHQRGAIAPFAKLGERLLVLAVAGLFVLMQFVVLLKPTGATDGPEVWICHASDSAQNPYQRQKKPYSAIDGGEDNDHSSHTGPVFDPEVRNQQNRGWGDIIPPVDGVNPGQNWTTEGQAIWNNECNPVGEVLGDECEAGQGWAHDVKDSDQGTRKNGSAVLAARSDPDNALDAPNGVFFSLGLGGWVEIEFNGYVADEPGNDVTIHEITNGPYPEEVASVEVSQDGSTWVSAGNVTNNGGSGGSSGVDISGTGFAWIKFVKVTDASNVALFANDADGFDLDAIEANIVCQIPEQPVEPCSVTAVSDSSTTVNEKGGANAVDVTFIHPAWTASIPSATWVWGDDPVADPVGETNYTFKRTFNWNGPVTSAVLDIATDNSYEVYVNGALLVGDASENNHGGVDTHNIPAGMIVNGENTLEFKVKNWAQPGGTTQSNPAGLLYKVVVTGTEEDCDEPPEEPEVPSVTLNAQKVVCDDEATLPNWGGGGPDITSATFAQDWVAQNPGCELVEDWSFEYKTQGDQSNPGGNVYGPKGGDWHTFTAVGNEASVEIPIDNVPLIQTREVLQDGYIPFSDNNQNDETAEFYCHTDVSNYDNWEWIQNLTDGTTYYCVAWNAEKPVSVLGTKIVCDTEDRLPNWGNGQTGPGVIEASTADDWLAEDDNVDHCQKVDWDFQWKMDPTGNPGDNTGAVGDGWQTFNTSSGLSLSAADQGDSSRVWVREVWDENYVPFTGQNTTEHESAEIYCHSDVLNYDNWDFIDNVQPGETYHCVAWNVLSTEGRIAGLIYNDEDESGSQDEGEPELEGWNALLLTKNSPYTVVGVDTTGPDGTFLFENLTFGTYYVCQNIQDGWLQTELAASGSGLDADTLVVGDQIPDPGDTLDALIAQYCYVVELTASDPESTDNIFGNFNTNSGRTLGDSDTKGEDEETPGNVLGTSTGGLGQGQVLAATGNPFAWPFIFGTIGVVLTIYLAYPARKSNETS